MKEAYSPIALDLPKGFPDSSRVWIYQSDRNFEISELEGLLKSCGQFANTWTAHNQKLKAEVFVMFERFICLVADESVAGASGCSIDSSVRFIQNLEKEYQISFMNRMLMAYLSPDQQVNTIHLNDLGTALKSGQVNENIIVFNNLVANLGDMKQSWMLPLGESWFMRFA